ncbi:MAG TPA: protein kinase [Cyclobacteriaceae bacterium]
MTGTLLLNPQQHQPRDRYAQALDERQNKFMSEILNFYDFDESQKKSLLEISYGKGKCILHTNGLCGDIFVFDQGENTRPRYTCIKLPKPITGVSNEETAKRFLRELKLQLSFYHNKFVNWAFDFDSIFDTPIAYFRYWGNDLASILKTNQPSKVTKLSLFVYTCVGLRHCYSKGLIAHQDLKPANIFIRNIKNDFVGLPDIDIYDFAMVADFGLANTFIDYKVFDGSRPYMAPEQWNKTELSQATDIFSLGVILFELMTNGYHPVGIKLNDFWPIPMEGNSKKWTRPDSWKKWIEGGCKIELPEGIYIEEHMLKFISKMLSVKSSHRPGLNEVIDFSLEQIKDISNESHVQLSFLIDYFDKQSLQTNNLETDWPYLFQKWENFRKRYE